MNSEWGRAKEMRAVLASPGLAVKTARKLRVPAAVGRAEEAWR